MKGGKNVEEVKNGRIKWKEWAKITQWQEEFPSHPDIQIWFKEEMEDGEIAEVIKKKDNQKLKEEIQQ